MDKQQKAEDFVFLWMKAKAQNKPQAWIAEMMGVSQAAVQFKATRYRAMGVNLPQLKYPKRVSVDVDKLNRQIDKAYVKAK